MCAVKFAATTMRKTKRGHPWAHTHHNSDTKKKAKHRQPTTKHLQKKKEKL